MAGKKGVTRTRSTGLRARAWWVLRKNKRTTLADLLMSLSDGSAKNPERNLGMYLTALVRVGIVTRQRIDDGKPTSNGVYQYVLTTDVGHKNPILRKNGIYDPNSQTTWEFSRHE